MEASNSKFNPYLKNAIDETQNQLVNETTYNEFFFFVTLLLVISVHLLSRKNQIFRF